MSTQRGLTVLVDMAERWVPGLNIDNATGRLIDQVQLTGIDYESAKQGHYQIKHFLLSWQPKRLLQGQLYIKSLYMEGVTFKTVAMEKHDVSQPIKLPQIVLPLQVVIADFKLNRLQQLQTDEQSQTLIDDLQIALSFKHRQLTIKHLHLRHNNDHVNLDGLIVFNRQYLIGLNYDYQISLPSIPSLQASGQISGNLQRLSIQQQTQKPLLSVQTVTLFDVLEKLKWKANINSKVIDLSKLIVDKKELGEVGQLHIDAQGTLNQIQANIAAQYKRPNMPDIQLTSKISSEDLNNWSIDAGGIMKGDRQLHVQGKINQLQQKPKLDLQGDWQDLQWPLTGTAQIASPQGQFKLNGTPDHYQLHVSTQIKAQQQLAEIKAVAEGNVKQALISSMHIKALSGETDITGKIDWAQPLPKFVMQANWQQIRLPDGLAPVALDSSQGRLTLDGTAQQFVIHTQASVSVDKTPLTIKSEAKGSQVGFQDFKLQLDAAQAGKVDFAGKLLWQPALSVNGLITLSDLNPGQFVKEWPGKLSGQGLLQLHQTSPQQTVIVADKVNLRGQLRQRPLALTISHAQYTPNKLQLSLLNIHSGRSSLAADGDLGDKWHMQWQLKSPDLADFYPQLSGTLQANGRVEGNLQQPQLSANIEGENVDYGKRYTIAGLKGDIQLGLSQGGQTRSQIQLSNISIDDKKINSVVLNLKGNELSHQVRLTAEASSLTLNTELDGSWSHQQWQGKFNSLQVTSQQAGKWQLEKAGQLVLAKGKLHIEQQCLQSGSGQVCIEAKSDQQQWQAKANFSGLPVALFSPLSPQLNQLKGDFEGQFSLVNAANQQLTGQGKLQLQHGELHLNSAAISQSKPVKLKLAELNFNLLPDRGQLQLAITPEIPGVSTIKGDINTASINKIITDPANAELKGNIQVAVADIAQLQLEHSQFDNLKGSVDFNTELKGTIEKPDFTIDAKLKQGQVSLPSAGITLHAINADVAGNLKQGITFHYQAKSGKGDISGDGKFAALKQSWQLQSHVTGKNVQLMNLPEAYVIASPDIQVDMTADKTLVAGTLTIPEATLEPLRFNMPVSPSDDVVIVTKHPKPVKKVSATQVNLKVKLGDKVKIKAIGFQGNLAGDLLISGDASQILLGTGDIIIKNGTYLAYGQLLKVDNGKIHFSGGALDNPDLDIKAVRTGTDYTVGVHIEGSASQPQASLYADPTMSQDDILSYLLLGKPIKQASATDAALLASAATGMGIQNGAMLGDQIASTFGLDEFSITGDSRENAALQIGKYLSPKLYLSYGVGVFQPVTTVQLRYQLSKIWALKAESGTESGVDFMYNYER